jgi:uncharacterized YccA/Bax inhibitor family protein
MRSSNAAISNLARNANEAVVDRASYKGVTFKTIYLAALTLVSSIVFAILLTNQATQEFVLWTLMPASIVAFIFAMIAIFAPGTTPVTGSVYCVLQGVVIGAISALVEIVFPGVAFMALLSTVGVFILMMVLYVTGVIKVGRFLQSAVISALMGVLLFSIIASIVSMFNAAARETLFGDSILALVVAVIVVIIASFCILLDLKQIDDTVKLGLDKKFEWRAAFGLIITLIWLYMEMVRLFVILSSRRRR